MTKQLDITLEEAIKYYNSSSDNGFKQLLEDKFGKNFWKPKEITDVVYDLSTLIGHLGYNPLIYPNPTTPFERYINACSVIAKVTEIYNEGTKLSWKNTDYKYYNYKYFSSGSFGVIVSWHRSGLGGSARFFYKSENLAKKGYENFKDFYEDYWSVN